MPRTADRSGEDPVDVWTKLGALAALLTAAAALARQRTPDAGTRATPDPHPDGEPARWKVRLDELQRARSSLGFAIGVAKKFGEDRAGHLAALVAYFGFFSVFPLMLAFTSVLGFVVTDPDDQRAFSEAASDQIPVLGETIRETAGRLEGSVAAVAVGAAFALWAGLRIVDAMQNALNDVWDIPRTERPKLAARRIRGVLMLLVILGGLIGSIAASNVASHLDVLPGAGRAGIWAASAAVSVAMYLLAFQLLTDARLPWRDLVPGAVFGGLCWWGLQTFGSVFIADQQQAAGDTYGEFAAVIALMAFFFLAAQLSILGAEISVVRARRLWPRSLVAGAHTEADLTAFRGLADATRQDDSYDVVVIPRS